MENNPRWHRFVDFLIITLLVMVFPSVASASPFCDELNVILSSSQDSFVTIRGKFNFDDDTYTGLAQISLFDECETESVDGVSNYSCRRKLRSDDEAIARSILQETAASIKECLGVKLNAGRNTSSRKISFRYLVNDDDVSVRYQRLGVNRISYYAITISIDSVQLR